MKNRKNKQRIPAHALDGLLDQVRAIRTRATPQHTPKQEHQLDKTTTMEGETE